MSGRADRPVPCGPYETEQQAIADVAYVYEQSLRSPIRGTLADANLAHLAAACERAGVALGAFDARILMSGSPTGSRRHALWWSG